MLEGRRFDITAPYSAVEAWGYDHLVAPAVLDLMREMIRLFEDRIPGSGHVLEVGCGGGQMASDVLKRFPSLRVTGLDLAFSQVRRARERTKRLNPRFRGLRASALELPFPRRTFDGVFSSASIKHWPDPLKGLKECVRVLKPGGYLLVMEADRGCRLDDARRFVNAWRIPSILKTPALSFFRTYVAGLGLDLDDARKLLSELPLVKTEARRIDGTPGLILAGQAR
ncbi:MAG: methyltransferase domain-containing protein [Nitrospirae bacterium]|nr:methyltransferase domain-containing protein [Nitrospirota bacterium]